jgi:proliferating cell nuclear antigen
MSDNLIICREDIELTEIPSDKVGFSTTNFKIFKLLINLISDTTDEVNFRFDEEGLSISCMDSGHISYIICNCPVDFFDNYNCPEPQVFGMNMKSLTKIFSIAKTNIGITVYFSDDEVNFFMNTGNQEKEYVIKQMVIDQEHLQIPDLDWEYSIKMTSLDFYNISHEISDIGDSCIVKLKNNHIQFSSDGDIGTIKIKTKPVEFNQNTEDKFTKFMFSSKYLFNYSKARALSPYIQLNLSKDTPMKMSYDLGNNAFIHNFLAPKITD